MLRELVNRCQRDLEPRGFDLKRRGSSSEHSWVQFRQPGRDDRGHHGAVVLTLAHVRPECALLADAYFVDSALQILTPRGKLVRRYGQDGEPEAVVSELVDAVRRWSN